MESKAADGVVVKEVSLSVVEVVEALREKIASNFIDENYHVHSVSLKSHDGLSVKALVTVSSLLTAKDTPDIKVRKATTENKRF